MIYLCRKKESSLRETRKGISELSLNNSRNKSSHYSLHEEKSMSRERPSMGVVSKVLSSRHLGRNLIVKPELTSSIPSSLNWVGSRPRFNHEDLSKDSIQMDTNYGLSKNYSAFIQTDLRDTSKDSAKIPTNRHNRNQIENDLLVLKTQLSAQKDQDLLHSKYLVSKALANTSATKNAEIRKSLGESTSALKDHLRSIVDKHHSSFKHGSGETTGVRPVQKAENLELLKSRINREFDEMSQIRPMERNERDQNNYLSHSSGGHNVEGESSVKTEKFKDALNNGLQTRSVRDVPSTTMSSDNNENPFAYYKKLSEKSIREDTGNYVGEVAKMINSTSATYIRHPDYSSRVNQPANNKSSQINLASEFKKKPTTQTFEIKPISATKSNLVKTRPNFGKTDNQVNQTIGEPVSSSTNNEAAKVASTVVRPTLNLQTSSSTNILKKTTTGSFASNDKANVVAPAGEKKQIRFTESTKKKSGDDTPLLKPKEPAEPTAPPKSTTPVPQPPPKTLTTPATAAPPNQPSSPKSDPLSIKEKFEKARLDIEINEVEDKIKEITTSIVDARQVADEMKYASEELIRAKQSELSYLEFKNSREIESLKAQLEFERKKYELMYMEALEVSKTTLQTSHVLGINNQQPPIVVAAKKNASGSSPKSSSNYIANTGTKEVEIIKKEEPEPITNNLESDEANEHALPSPQMNNLFDSCEQLSDIPKHN